LIGTVALIGPQSLATTVTVLSGRPAAGSDFTLKVSGVSLPTSGRVRLVNYDVLCGGIYAATSTSKLGQGSVDGAGTAASDGSLAWSGLQLFHQGTYRVCWCAAVGSSCSVDADFNVDVGTFSVDGPTALQDAGATPTTSTFFCSFETSDIGTTGCLIWNQLDHSDNGEWTRATGSTPTAGTGPTGPQSDTYYMFLNADDVGLTTGHVAYLVANQSFGVGATLEFWYHMTGANMGTLRLELKLNDESEWITLEQDWGSGICLASGHSFTRRLRGAGPRSAFRSCARKWNSKRHCHRHHTT
jgi:hypothetical protein